MKLNYFKSVLVAIVGASLLFGCAMGGIKVPDGVSVGKYNGYVYTSSIDPGVILNEWDVVEAESDGMGGLVVKYENPCNKVKSCSILNEPTIVVMLLNEYGQLNVYAWVVNGEMQTFESYQVGVSFYYREVEWNSYNLMVRGWLMELLGLAPVSGIFNPEESDVDGLSNRKNGI